MAASIKRFHFESIAFVISVLLVAYIFLSHPQLGIAIESIGQSDGPIPAFVAGFFYSISVTAPAAAATIFYLGKVQNIFFIAFIGAIGSLISDYLLFRFIRKNASRTVHYLTGKLKTKSKNVKLLATIVACLIMASPLPDEIGVAILAAINVKLGRFLIYSFVLSFLGILTMAWLGSVL